MLGLSKKALSESSAPNSARILDTARAASNECPPTAKKLSSRPMPGRPSNRKPFAANALNKALDGVTFELDSFTIHDMRRTASTLLNGNGWPSDAIELALGHQIGGIRRVYNVADYATERKKMLQWWGNYIDGVVRESNLTEGNFGAA